VGTRGGGRAARGGNDHPGIAGRPHRHDPEVRVDLFRLDPGSAGTLLHDHIDQSRTARLEIDEQHNGALCEVEVEVAIASVSLPLLRRMGIKTGSGLAEAAWKEAIR
jgi:hypothetical protein